MRNRALAVLVAVALAATATASLLAYVRAADRRAVSGQRPLPVLVARARIPAGTTGEQAQNRGLVERAELPRRAVARDALRSVGQLAGRVAAVDIVAGEQLLASRWVGPGQAGGAALLPIPAGHQAVSISLDATRQVSGFVTPGDHVSLLVSLDQRGGGRVTRFLLQDAAVLAVGATAAPNPEARGPRAGQAGASPATVTLAVPSGDVERVVFAAENGSLYLTLLPPDQRPVAGGGRTLDNEFGR
jgi:pilus assembly protein CpaB